MTRPVTKLRPSRKAYPGFRIHDGKGFHITFPNQWSVSVQFGYGNYCQNHDSRPEVTSDDWRERNRQLGALGSATAETAVIDPNGNLVTYPPLPDDTVQGHQTPSDVLTLLQWAASQ